MTPCKNQLLFENGVPAKELLYEDGTCKHCGCRYHCSRCKQGTAMMGHTCPEDHEPKSSH